MVLGVYLQTETTSTSGVRRSVLRAGTNHHCTNPKKLHQSKLANRSLSKTAPASTIKRDEDPLKLSRAEIAAADENRMGERMSMMLSKMSPSAEQVEGVEGFETAPGHLPSAGPPRRAVWSSRAGDSIAKSSSSEARRRLPRNANAQNELEKYLYKMQRH